MTALRFDAGLSADLARIALHLAEHEVANIGGRLDEILDALQLLALHPLIGRKAGQTGLRELVIGRGSRGYVALYRYESLDDEVTVLALRGQQEAGFEP